MSNLGYLFYNDLYSTTNSSITINNTAKHRLLNYQDIKENNGIYKKGKNGFELFTTYPGLTTGTGLPHGIKGENDDFKIGCYFDFTTGLPTLPGSLVKGVLRSMFPSIEKKQSGNEESFHFKDELRDEVKAKWLQAQLDNINEEGFFEKYYQPKEDIKTEEIKNLYAITLAIFEGVKNYTESEPENRLYSIYKRDIFEDAYIVKSEHSDGKVVATDSITPHIQEKMSYAESQLKNPTPLLFLKVLPNVQFRFNFTLHNFNEIITSETKEKLFKKILLTIGAGAKTNVGYGQFSEKKIEVYQTSNSTQNSEGVKNTPKTPKTPKNFKEKYKEQVKAKEGLNPGDLVYAVVDSINKDKIFFNPLIAPYEVEKLPSVMAGNIASYVNKENLISLKISKVKEDGTFTFKDAKQVKLKK